ncbi:hypothetical protein C6354_12530 [Bacillus velezensis]|nr:hypothetical protein C6354_12530 [Bacillus velezensis]
MTLLLIDMKRTVNLCLFNLFHQEALHLNMKRTRKETLIKINLSENWPYLLKSCFDFRVMNTKVLTHFINMPPQLEECIVYTLMSSVWDMYGFMMLRTIDGCVLDMSLLKFKLSRLSSLVISGGYALFMEVLGLH